MVQDTPIHALSQSPLWQGKISDHYIVVQHRIKAHAALVRLYLAAHNPRQAGYHFEQLLHEVPTPRSILISSARASCERTKDIGKLKAIDAIAIDIPEERLSVELLQNSCFEGSVLR